MNNEILDYDIHQKGIQVQIINETKFIILYFASFGLYGIWWMYKAWKFFREKDSMDIMPVARAIFAIIFTHVLIEKVQNYAHTNGYVRSYSSSFLFISLLILNTLSKLPDPYWLLSFLAFIPLIKPLNAFNFAIRNSEDYHAIDSSGFNGKQIGLLVIGALLFALIIIGLFVYVE